ncbi:uncharacterized protein J4E84_010293 [Alternaria hordeiaustralica]|uniref:uncharacterized protein n=1 Tax=Alternaria hordeiaustralica TaxID=1187925 RepID=UPI0020C3D3C6|nr:uncharacterized protein J4E84_010293 [Alternaria hordeiaustralica]KAI4674852.1 hypothetical protein J4E84_010293 [Alternaria hordeiaustralica]
MSESAQIPDITAAQGDPVVDPAQSSMSSPVHTEDSQAGDQMLREEEQSPPAIVEGTSATGTSATGSLTDEDEPPTASMPVLRVGYNRVIKCVTCRANDLPCDNLDPCNECYKNETDCVRRRCGFAAKEIGERCELLCDRLHFSDVAKESEADSDKMNKRKREVEDSGAEEKGPDKAMKDAVLGERTSDEQAEGCNSLEEMWLAARTTSERERIRDRMIDEQMARAKEEVAARMAAGEYQKDDVTKGEDKKAKKSAVAIAYAYLADGTRVAAQDVEAVESALS